MSFEDVFGLTFEVTNLTPMRLPWGALDQVQLSMNDPTSFDDEIPCDPRHLPLILRVEPKPTNGNPVFPRNFTLTRYGHIDDNGTGQGVSFDFKLGGSLQLGSREYWLGSNIPVQRGHVYKSKFVFKIEAATPSGNMVAGEWSTNLVTSVVDNGLFAYGSRGHGDHGATWARAENDAGCVATLMGPTVLADDSFRLNYLNWSDMPTMLNVFPARVLPEGAMKPMPMGTPKAYFGNDNIASGETKAVRFQFTDSPKGGGVVLAYFPGPKAISHIIPVAAPEIAGRLVNVGVNATNSMPPISRVIQIQEGSTTALYVSNPGTSPVDCRINRARLVSDDVDIDAYIVNATDLSTIALIPTAGVPDPSLFTIPPGVHMRVDIHGEHAGNVFVTVVAFTSSHTSYVTIPIRCKA